MRLSAEGLAVRRGEDLVFTGVSFVVDEGGVLVVTGANGSGKSTLLRAVAGLLPIEKGRLGLEAAGSRNMRIGENAHYLGHRDAMKRELSVAENLVFWQRFMAGERGGAALSIGEAAEAVGLGAISHLPFGYLSAGQQRRMAMARLLVVHRPIWLLDEPTSALDATSEAMFAELVRSHCAAGGIAIAATHRPLGLADPQHLEMSRYRTPISESEAI